MRSLCLGFALALLLSHGAEGHQPAQAPSVAGGEPTATLLRGMGSHHHPVSTVSADAQMFFDQGLTLVYAFNHPEAVRSFERAAQLDPQMTMAYWGIALALGSNINSEIDSEREKAAYEAVQKARMLAAAGPEPERQYVAALAKRYSILPQADRKALNVEYKNAMGELVRRYPHDLDAATLFAEAAMVLRPWRLWTADGRPEEGTREIVAALESVLRRDPLLYPRRRGIAAPGAGAALCRHASRARAGGWAPRPHAGAYLRAAGRLHVGRSEQQGGRAGR